MLKVFDLLLQLALPVAIASFVVVYMPEEMAQEQGLYEIQRDYKGWFLIAGIIGLSSWAASFLKYTKNKWVSSSLRKKERHNIIESLSSLSEEENTLVGYCLLLNRRTITVPLINSVANSLVSKGLLIQARGGGNMLAWPYTIPDFVWIHLQIIKHEWFSADDLMNDNLRQNYQAFYDQQRGCRNDRI